MFKSLFILTVCIFGLVFSQGNETTAFETTNHETTEHTTIQTNTTATTTKLTTTASDKPAVLNFTVSDGNNTCLLLQFAIDMHVTYVADADNNAKTNKTITYSVPADYNNYSGKCQATLNKFALTFWNNWTLEMDFSLNGDKYELSGLILNYYINSTWFPNASPESVGTQIANNSGLHEFSTNKGSSFRCSAKTTVVLDPKITLDITNYQGEPFYQKDANKEIKFHTAVDCPADQTGTSKLVPIIVGAALAFLVLLVLIAYLIGRRKHRSGYQSV